MVKDKNSVVWLYIAAPFDKQYRNCLYTRSNEGTKTYLDNYCTLSICLKSQSLIRPFSGKMLLNVLYDDGIQQVNYAVIKNPHNSKYFYAFVDNINYINENTIEVCFSLDYVQTYINDVSFNRCFIVRQHSTHDSIGHNTEIEPVAVGKMINDGTESIIDLPIKYAIACTESPFTDEGEHQYFWENNGKVGSNLYYVKFDTITDLQKALQTLQQGGKTDKIINVFSYPDSNTDGWHIPRLNTLNGYTPRNKKLFTSQFCRVLVTNNCGDYFCMGWEFSANKDDIEMCVRSTPHYGTPAAMIFPKQYNNRVYDYDSCCIIKNFCLFGYLSEIYTQWYARNKNQYETAITNELGAYTVGQSSNIITSLATLEPLSLVGGYMGGSQRLLIADATRNAMTADMANVPASAKGAVQCGDLVQSMGRLNFTVLRQCCTAKIAEKIDLYFDMYGYAQNTVFEPNLTARPHYTYIQTSNCSSYGNAPATALQIFNQIMDNGVTWWRGDCRIGDRSVDNTI